jgi:ubiquinone/menaquinone biosynthesis C-methylase UbiE
MGEQIHVGGAEQTDILARKIGVSNMKPELYLLDICSALGGPARHLADKYGIKVLGVDITPEMIQEAIKRTTGKPYEKNIEFRLGNALDIPSHSNTFDIIWGQDAWCYIRDKQRLIEETWRVLKSSGKLAFTDWIWGSVFPSEEESDELMEFMVFPNLETCKHMDIYVETLISNKDQIISNFGTDLYMEAEKGVIAWQKAAHEKIVSRGLWIASKS